MSFLEAGNVGVSYARGEIHEIINTAPGSPMLSYVRSILHPPKGPIDWIVEYLKSESAASDRVKISYGDLPLMFHTDLTVTSSADA